MKSTRKRNWGPLFLWRRLVSLLIDVSPPSFDRRPDCGPSSPQPFPPHWGQRSQPPRFDTPPGYARNPKREPSTPENKSTSAQTCGEFRGEAGMRAFLLQCVAIQSCWSNIKNSKGTGSTPQTAPAIMPCVACGYQSTPPKAQKTDSTLCQRAQGLLRSVMRLWWRVLGWLRG
jgi:hypothetical protein